VGDCTSPGAAGEDAVTVRSFALADREAWNAFVLAHPEGTFFHLAEWQYVLEHSFGHTGHYLLAVTPRGEIRGVLPLARVKSLLFGDALVSTPFCVYGGIVAADETAHSALTTAACKLARELDVDHLEMRNRRRQHPDWIC
jgi:CelD/BcsL family acetyltransferase involved in cellulose biosynthesis